MTLEGGLLAKWRKACALSQTDLGEVCPRRLGYKAISRYEREDSSMAIDTLLNVVRGLERGGKIKLGRDDGQRLAAFFLGPDRYDAWRRKVAASREIVALDEEKERS